MLLLICVVNATIIHCVHEAFGLEFTSFWAKHIPEQSRSNYRDELCAEILQLTFISWFASDYKNEQNKFGDKFVVTHICRLRNVALATLQRIIETRHGFVLLIVGLLLLRVALCR